MALAQMRKDTLCGHFNPRSEPSALLGTVVQNALRCLNDIGWVSHNQGVGAFAHGDGSLCVVAQSKAGHAEGGGFFLQVSAVVE